MSDRPTRPPHLATWLIERVIPADARDAAIGDLNEEFERAGAEHAEIAWRNALTGNLHRLPHAGHRHAAARDRRYYLEDISAAALPIEEVLRRNRIAEPMRRLLPRSDTMRHDIRDALRILLRRARANVQRRRGQPGKDKVAVITYKLWQRQFAGDPAVIGRVVTFNGELHTIIGVMPAASAFERGNIEVWRPLAFRPADMTRKARWLRSVAR